MNYCEIKRRDIANGIGVRVSLFVSGCRHHCKGCFNSEAWDFDAGRPYTKDTEAEVLRMLDDQNVRGLSLLGGEPLEPENQGDVLGLLEAVSDRLPDKDVWLWTGFTFEGLTGGCRASTPTLKKLLGHVDVMVDGPFVESDRDITLRFRGSPNQRILDLRKSMASGSPVPWTDGPVLSTRRWMETS